MQEQQQNDNREKDEFFDFEPEPAPKAAAPERERANPFKTAAVIFLSLALAAVGFLAGWLGRYYSLDGRLRTILWAKDVTQNNYYRDIDEDKLYEDMMAALESQIDIYSGFYTPSAYEDLMREGAGENIGIGVSLSDETVGEKTLPRIMLIPENSPAQEAGLKKGMYVVGYGETSADFTGNSEALSKFLTGRTTAFTLRCGFSADGSGAKDYRLSRREYQAAFCHYRDSQTSFAFRGEKTLTLTETHEPLAGLDDKTAYIRLDEFSGNAAEEMTACLTTMKERGRTDLILDLRTNGGGYMNILCSIASHLMKNATGNAPVVAKARYKSGKISAYTATGNDYYSYFTKDSKIKILADENTASASECLIGAMVDYGTAGFDDIYVRANTPTGGRSYGKGIMQGFFPSAQGAVMKLTVATVHWPVTDKCIQDVGVTTEDGAVAVEAPLIWGATDPFLTSVLKDFCA